MNIGKAPSPNDNVAPIEKLGAKIGELSETLRIAMARTSLPAVSSRERRFPDRRIRSER